MDNSNKKELSAHKYEINCFSIVSDGQWRFPIKEATKDRTIKCYQCYKQFHFKYLRPFLSPVPQNGWRCSSCQICILCELVVPEKESHSRWNGYTIICDSCYQKRNTGFSCAVCNQIFRANLYKDMVRCTLCRRFLHFPCDVNHEIMKSQPKEKNYVLNYLCPTCRNAIQLSNNYSNPVNRFPDYFDCEHKKLFKNLDCIMNSRKKKTHDKLKMYKRHMEFKVGLMKEHRKKLSSIVLQKTSAGNSLGLSRKVMTTKQRKIIASKSNKTSRFINMEYVSLSISNLFNERTIISFSANELFLLSKDVCLLCGCIGLEDDGCLIACWQCGQCFHIYCANVEYSKLFKGWRCFNCKICDVCGGKEEKGSIICCVGCKTSFHTYCLNLPVIKSSDAFFTCKACFTCEKCGEVISRRADLRQNGLCDLCTSQSVCSVCSGKYKENDLIVQCSKCKCWSHPHFIEKLRETSNQISCSLNCYCCLICLSKNSRRKCKSNRHLKPLTSLVSTCTEKSNFAYQTPLDVHYVDGVYISERGLNMITSQSYEIKKKRKNKVDFLVVPSSTTFDNGISKLNGGSYDLQINIFNNEIPFENKSIPVPPPTCTNTNGISTIRKKRSRNLEKLGIGGFVSRNRILKMNDKNVEHKKSCTRIIDKKNMLRKPTKYKINDTYPVNLREAFFGHSLLNIKPTKSFFLEQNFVHEATDILSSISSPKNEFLLSHELKNPEFFNKKTAPNANSYAKNTKVDSEIYQKLNLGDEKLSASHTYNSFPSQKNKLSSTVSNSNSFDKHRKVSEELLSTNTNEKFMFTKRKSEDLMTCCKHKVQSDIFRALSTGINLENDIESSNYMLENIELEKYHLGGVLMGSQKTAEKMRLDEDLGNKATISAVLYANKQHPDLKMKYPYWNDRCKQILKNWRSLSTVMKAPFLQQAKENRSILRTNKNYQDQNNISAPHTNKYTETDLCRADERFELCKKDTVKVALQEDPLKVNIEDTISQDN